jgi:hypothetical protein
MLILEDIISFRLDFEKKVNLNADKYLRKILAETNQILNTSLNGHSCVTNIDFRCGASCEGKILFFLL